MRTEKNGKKKKKFNVDVNLMEISGPSGRFEDGYTNS